MVQEKLGGGGGKARRGVRRAKEEWLKRETQEAERERFEGGEKERVG